MGWLDSPRSLHWEAPLVFVDRIFRQRAITFDAIYSSNLERARQTAVYFAQNHSIDIVKDSAQLNELDYGELSSKTKRWVAEFFPQYKKDPDLVYPGGESFRQMQARSVDFIRSLTHIRADQTLLMVLHAGVIRGLVCHVLNLDCSKYLRQRIPHGYIGDFEFEGARCVRYDEIGRRSGFVRKGTIETPCYPQATEEGEVN
jgi:broad specificity phosphatase PhoE